METWYKMRVLILVLVEHTLRGRENVSRGVPDKSLNPCFSGTYSQRHSVQGDGRTQGVLILVLVEHTLRDKGEMIMNRDGKS